MSLSTEEKLCFIGAGSMAEAIIRGLVDKKTAAAEQISVINRQNVNRLTELHARYGIDTPHTDEAKQLAIENASVIILAMKPKDAAAAIEQLGKQLSNNLRDGRQLIVSVIAGLSIRSMASRLPATVPIVRTMPNTSSMIGQGVTGISFSAHVSEQQRTTTLAMFNSIGMTVTVDEPQLDVITGVSGSGPAYVYYMMEAMIEAAVAGGIEAEQAKSLVAQTVLGAAQMVTLTGEAPNILRQNVTSPNGTTEAALKLMAERQFPQTVVDAVKRSSERAAEIGRSIE